MDNVDSSSERLALAGFVAASRANGPGVRIVVWVQGCSIGCPGCFNPGTHEVGSPDSSIGDVLARILAAVGPETNGVTFSGGEPFEQAEALAVLAGAVRRAWPEGTLMAYSGYTLAHLQSEAAPPGSSALLGALDYLVDGPFEVRLPGQEPWQASANQQLRILGRPLPGGVDPAAGGHVGEFHVLADGTVLLSGLPDPKLRSVIKTVQ